MLLLMPFRCLLRVFWDLRRQLHQVELHVFRTVHPSILNRKLAGLRLPMLQCSNQHWSCIHPLKVSQRWIFFLSFFWGGGRGGGGREEVAGFRSLERLKLPLLTTKLLWPSCCCHAISVVIAIVVDLFSLSTSICHCCWTSLSLMSLLMSLLLMTLLLESSVIVSKMCFNTFIT